MNRIVTRPDGLDLDSPGRRDYWVALEHDSIWGDHLIPLTVFVGPEAQQPLGRFAGSPQSETSERWCCRNDERFAAVALGKHKPVEDYRRLSHWPNPIRYNR